MIALFAINQARFGSIFEFGAKYQLTVADVSTFLRVAITGKTNSPDLFVVTQILGYDRTVERVKNAINSL